MCAREKPPHLPRSGGDARPLAAAAQVEANAAAELNQLLNAIAACGDRLAGSPEEVTAARLDLLAIAGRAARAILDARRHGVSLRGWLGVNAALRRLEPAVRVILPPSVVVALDLDPSAGLVHLAPGELDLLILNLVLDVRARVGEYGSVVIRSAREVQADADAVAIAVADLPDIAARGSEGTQFGLATVRLLLRDAAGGVALQRGAEGGCEVRIRLPAQPRPRDT